MSSSTAENTSTRVEDSDLSIQYRNDYVVGFFFMLPALPGLIIYIPVMMVLLSPAYKKDFSSSFYVILKSLGFADIAALILWIILSLHTLTHGQMFPHQIVAFLFWPLDITWVVLVWHLVLMSINRYVAICHMTKMDSIFSIRNTLFFVGLIYFVAWLVLMPFAFPCCQMGFSFKGYFPVHRTDQIWFKIWQNFDFVEFPLAFVVCLASHILVTIKYRSIKRTAHHPQSQQHNSQTSGNRRSDRKEFRMFLQTVTVCLAFLVCDLLYNTVWLGTSDIWINFFTGMWLWELNNMIGPVIYLIFNPSIRTKVISLCFGKKIGGRLNGTFVSVIDRTVNQQL